MHIDLSQSRQQVLQPTTIPQQSLDPFLGHIDLFHWSQWLWLLFFQDSEKNRFSAEISQRGLCWVVHWGMQVRPWALPLQICCSTETLIVVSQWELDAPLQPYSPASPATFFFLSLTFTPLLGNLEDLLTKILLSVTICAWKMCDPLRQTSKVNSKII